MAKREILFRGWNKKTQNLLKQNNMKAKVIETGEIVDVSPNGEKTVQHRCTEYVTADGRELLDMELDFLPTIDWEQRRYEIARDIMVASFDQPMSGASVASHVHNCVLWADDLIEELKKESK